MNSEFFLPLLNVTLQGSDKFDIGFGLSIVAVPDDYYQLLKTKEELYIGYQKSIENLTVGLSFQPVEGHPIQSVFPEEAQYYCIFIAFILRLITGIPVDLPFWFFSLNEKKSMGYGRTFIRTYRNEPSRYTYPLDRGDCFDVVNLFGKNIEKLSRRIIKYLNEAGAEDRLIRAAEFISFAYQMYHITPRLVNAITFLEILFSSSRIEISHQLAERISWYLEPVDAEARIDLYKFVKDLYNKRSSVVHGENPKAKSVDLKNALIEAESLNTRIFKSILENNHIEAFSLSEGRRKNELRKLGLGVPCEFLMFS